MNKNMVLLRTLLLSTSQRNCYHYCKDAKKRGRIIGRYVGLGILFVMLIAYCILQCIGYGIYGLTDSIPCMNALLICAMSFVMTYFKTNGYLFNFKEYDMLMSLPIEAKNIAACKFGYMYLKSLPWYMAISLSMLTGYGIYAKPAIAVYPIWVLLSLFLPVIPMLLAAFIGFLIARFSSGFKNKNIAMTVFSILIVLLCFGFRFFLEYMFRENKTEDVLQTVSDATNTAGKFYPPIKWFAEAAADCRISSILLLIGCSVLLFEIIFIPVGRSYRKINSALKTHSSSGKFVMKTQKSNSLLNAIAFKEWKRMLGSSVYLTNICIGELLCFAAGIAVLFVDFDALLRDTLQIPILTKEMLWPAIPLIVYLMVGMVATTAISPSIEGKNYWIVQSLPISKKQLYQGKMLFNLYLTVPFAVFTTITGCISAQTGILTAVLCVLLSILLCVFSTAWGCVCGIRHINLEWENEVEVIKQGAAVALYLFPNMIVTLVLIALSMYLSTFIRTNLIILIMLLLVSVVTAVCYRAAVSAAEKS